MPKMPKFKIGDIIRSKTFNYHMGVVIRIVIIIEEFKVDKVEADIRYLIKANAGQVEVIETDAILLVEKKR